uniref:Synaptogyrin 3 n=1 Tax=Bos taurus TaxID=9913 RepID=A0AAA9TA64_BOVIN
MPPLSPLHIYSPNPADSSLGVTDPVPTLWSRSWETLRAPQGTEDTARMPALALTNHVTPGQVTSPAEAPSSLSTKQIRTMAPSRLFRRIPCANKVFSIAVFGPIVNEGYVNADSGPELRCVFNGNAGACRFGVALGLGAFLACSCFLLLDVRFQQISSVRDRRRAVLLDLGFSGLWSFLWFVGFCFLTNQWQRTAPGPGTAQAGDAARAVITFSFFSILSWVALTVKALQRFRLGTDMSLFATEQLGAGAGQTYPGYPVGSGVEGTDTYQSPPFTETLDTSPKGYQVPAY